MSIRQLDHLRAPLRLTSLPPEIMVCIFQSCSILSRINLALTCRHLAKSAVVNRLLSFDTGSKAAGREIVRNDEFVAFSIVCVITLHSRIARRPFLKLEYLPTSRVPGRVCQVWLPWQRSHSLCWIEAPCQDGSRRTGWSLYSGYHGLAGSQAQHHEGRLARVPQ